MPIMSGRNAVLLAILAGLAGFEAGAAWEHAPIGRWLARTNAERLHRELQRPHARRAPSVVGASESISNRSPLRHGACLCSQSAVARHRMGVEGEADHAKRRAC